MGEQIEELAKRDNHRADSDITQVSTVQSKSLQNEFWPQRRIAQIVVIATERSTGLGEL